MKENLNAKGLPGSEKLLKGFNKSGPNSAKTLQKPKEDPRFSQGAEKKKKTVKESINNGTDMVPDKFEKLFEDVMNDDDLGELGINSGEQSNGEGDVEFTHEPGEGESTGDKLRSIIAQVEDILRDMGESTEDDVEGDGESHEDIENRGEGDNQGDTLSEEEVEAEFRGTPLVNQKKSEIDNSAGKSGNKVNSPGTKPSGQGKADNGKIPEPHGDTTPLSDEKGKSLEKHGNEKVQSKIKGKNQSLFHV